MEIKLRLNKTNEVNNILPLVNYAMWYTKKHFKMISLILTVLTIHTHTHRCIKRLLEAIDTFITLIFTMLWWCMKIVYIKYVWFLVFSYTSIKL